ncbi:MAG: monooxygenase [Pseudonocardiales bacterium]|jgi:cation diffusion facilitator CzcD-associated flavoprotein CzcO|nr:monooxygenase [Pseudonocardiales bacterium]
MAVEHVDVLIVGAGLSGVGAACHLTRESPGKGYLILERRERMGGTWDLFRYPGIRSDSDMFTFGYNFRPWNETKVLADGPSIRQYVVDTAAEYGVDQHIRYGITVTKASWSSEQSQWTIETRDAATGRTKRFTADFVIACTGYYNYDEGYRPSFPDEDAFTGPIVHPQYWPEDLDYRGKQIVIIGSGATAVTLVPAMADDAAHVTMLQRSPTYILSLPARDKLSEQLRRVLPDDVVFRLARRRNISIQRGLYRLSRSRPGAVRSLILKAAERQLRGRSNLKHFTPEYDPWDQRLCVVPDGDLFKVIRAGKADIVTDRIKRFTASGIELESGAELAADIIISATGLNVQLLGGAEIEVDGEPLPLNQRVTYKSVLLEGVPNAAIVFGYTNASWTLKADLAAEYTCRLLNHMDAHGHTQVVVRAGEADRGEDSVLGALDSGYVRRGNDRLPRQGTHGPWKVSNDYLRDVPMLRRAPIDDGVLQFSSRPPARKTDRPRPRVTA